MQIWPAAGAAGDWWGTVNSSWNEHVSRRPTQQYIAPSRPSCRQPPTQPHFARLPDCSPVNAARVQVIELKPAWGGVA
jgi:hypothetical protein